MRQIRLKNTSFENCERGSVAVIFSLALIPMLGMIGAALDYGRAARIKEVQQSISDATALYGASAETSSAAALTLAFAQDELLRRLGDRSSTSGYTVTGAWIDGANFRVTVTSSMRTAMIHLLPGAPDNIVIRTVTTVNRIPPRYETAPPKVTQLSPDASDYNRIYVYCYSSDPVRQAAADGGRRQLTPIADNATPPTDYSSSTPPKCEENEAPSYMLRNVRDARTNRAKWDDPRQGTYLYYGDVSIDPGTRVQTVSMKGVAMSSNGTSRNLDMARSPNLETILCDTLSQCRPRSEGGILPDGTGAHTAARAGQGCVEGKFMYYGWEDRPSVNGVGSDYNDIRVVVECPKLVKIGDKRLRIVE